MNTVKNYKTFFNGLSADLLKELGADYEAQAITNTQNNGIFKKGILIRHRDESSAPAIYLDTYYEDFCTGKCLNDIIRQVLFTYRDSSDLCKKQCFQEIDFTPCAMKNKIILRMVNYARNAESLRTLPHIRIHDLAIIFHFMIYRDEESIGTIKFTREHFRDYTDNSGGKTPIFTTLGELFFLALENTKKIFPARLNYLDDVLNVFLSGQDFSGQSPSRRDLPSIPFSTTSLGEKDTDKTLFVFTNELGINGAACILYPDILAKLTAYFGSDFYILPSSIHELLLLPGADAFCREELNDIIREINLSQVPGEEMLSDHAYHSKDLLELLKLPDSILSIREL